MYLWSEVFTCIWKAGPLSVSVGEERPLPVCTGKTRRKPVVYIPLKNVLHRYRLEKHSYTSKCIFSYYERNIKARRENSISTVVIHLLYHFNSFIPSDAELIFSNSMLDPEEMAPRGAISPGSMLFAILLIYSVHHPFLINAMAQIQSLMSPF